MKGARNLADANAIAMRSANCSVIVHRKHVLDLREVVLRGREPLYAEAALGWDRFRRSFCPRVGPFYALISMSLLTLLSIGWIALAVYTWDYKHTDIVFFTVLAGFVLCGLWL